MTLLRLFVAIDLPASIRETLSAVHADIPGASWSKTANLHLTLKFLGDGIDDGRVPGIVEALGTVEGAPFELALSGVGRFPPGDRQPARVLWAGLAAPPALAELAADIEQALVPLGFPAERRAFSPHLTLARLKPEMPAAAVYRFLDRQAELASEPFTVDGFALYSSVLASQGATYSRLARFSLE